MKKSTSMSEYKRTAFALLTVACLALAGAGCLLLLEKREHRYQLTKVAGPEEGGIMAGKYLEENRDAIYGGCVPIDASGMAALAYDRSGKPVSDTDFFYLVKLEDNWPYPVRMEIKGKIRKGVLEITEERLQYQESGETVCAWNEEEKRYYISFMNSKGEEQEIYSWVVEFGECPVQKLPVGEMRVAQDVVKLRKGPGVAFDVAALAAEGEKLRVTGETINESGEAWFMVEPEGIGEESRKEHRYYIRHDLLVQ